MPRPTFAFSIRSCREKSLIPKAHTFGVMFPNSQDYPTAMSTAPGKRRHRRWPNPGLNWAKTTRCPSSTTQRQENARWIRTGQREAER